MAIKRNFFSYLLFSDILGGIYWTSGYYITIFT